MLPVAFPNIPYTIYHSFLTLYIAFPIPFFPFSIKLLPSFPISSFIEAMSNYSLLWNSFPWPHNGTFILSQFLLLLQVTYSHLKILS